MKVAQPVTGSIMIELTPGEAIVLAQELDAKLQIHPLPGGSHRVIIAFWKALYAALGVQVSHEDEQR